MARMVFADWTGVKEWISRWIGYVGVRRLVAGFASAVVVAGALWLLVRPSGMSVESMLPLASGSSLVPQATTEDRPTTVVVHVAGAVRKPGVYHLPATARVIDAVTIAGGATARADLENINLAQTIVDTEQVFVPTQGRSRSATRVEPRLRPRRNSTSSPPTMTATTINSSSPIPAEMPTSGPTRVNLNTATVSDLDTLPGVGPSTARAIVAYRTKHGAFTRVEDLLNVSGIGPSKLAAMRDRVSV